MKIVTLALLLVAATAEAAPSPAVAALQAGRFDDAQREAAKDPSASGHLVAAVARYEKAAMQLGADLRTLAFGAMSGRGGSINLPYLRFAFGNFDKELNAVDADLAAAAQDSKVSLELCLACWKIDWNGDGRIRDNDSALLEIEQDTDGKEIPADDQRRRPTFRFDVGDVWWARAMLAFQHSLVHLALAYRWNDVDALIKSREEPRGKTLLVHLDDKARVTAAQKSLFDALAWSDRARKEYLAETDDDREWVPNPRQKSHPMPLPVDAALYQTWVDVLADLKKLLTGEEGLQAAEVGKLADLHDKNAPRGFFAPGKIFSEPKDISIPFDDFTRLVDHPSQNPDASLRAVFGGVYVDKMKPSLLPSRMQRMKAELERGTESLEHKLRYLFWIN